MSKEALYSLFLVTSLLASTMAISQSDQQTNLNTTINIPTITSACAYENPLLVICIMVKNEEHVIKQTLEPYVKNGVDAFFIYDTGSTDKTLEVALNYLKASGIEHAYSAQEPFIDFAASRNKALEYCRAKFPKVGFILMPDAEWYMHNVKGLLEFCKQHLHDQRCGLHLGPCPSFLVRIMNESTDFYTPRLMRGDSPTLFVGKVHEVLIPAFDGRVPGDVFFYLGTTQQGSEKTRKRFVRDLEIFLKEYEKNPTDPRTVFYLAQTYDGLQDCENAAKYYKIRLAMNGFDEENFITAYRIAMQLECIGIKNKTDTWPEAFSYYLKAHQMRPHRAEPLIKIADHYHQTGDFALEFIFARRAAELPYPEKDGLFIEKYMYNFSRYDRLGSSAWYLGECPLAERAIRTALQYQEMPHLYRNLAGVLECTNKGSNLWGSCPYKIEENNIPA